MTDFVFVYHKGNEHTYGPWTKEHADSWIEQQGTENCEVISASVAQRGQKPPPEISDKAEVQIAKEATRQESPQVKRREA